MWRWPIGQHLTLSTGKGLKNKIRQLRAKESAIWYISYNSESSSTVKIAAIHENLYKKNILKKSFERRDYEAFFNYPLSNNRTCLIIKFPSKGLTGNV